MPAPDLARAHTRLGLIRSRKGDESAAIADFHKALSLYRRSEASHPPSTTLEIAETLQRIGTAQYGLGRLPESEKSYREALTSIEEFSGTVTETQRFLHAKVLTNLGRIYEDRNQFELALLTQRNALNAVPTKSRLPAELARTRIACRTNLANALRGSGKTKEAVDDYTEVITLSEDLIEKFPGTIHDTVLLAENLRNIAFANSTLGEHEKAHAAIQKATTIWQELIASYSLPISYENGIISAHQTRGNLYRSEGLYGLALEQFQKAIDGSERLMKSSPDLSEPVRDLYQALQNTAIVLHTQAKDDEAESAIRRAIKIQLKLIESEPEFDEYRGALGKSRNILGNIYAARRRTDEARREFEQSRIIFGDLAATTQKPLFRHEYVNSLLKLTATLGSKDHRDESLKHLREAVDVSTLLVNENEGVVEYIVDLALSHGRYGGVVVDRDRHEAVKRFGVSIDLLQELADRGVATIDSRRLLGAYHAKRALAYEADEKRAHAIHDWTWLVDHNEGARRTTYRVFRCLAKARSSDHVGAMAEAEELKTVKLSGEMAYELARVSAICQQSAEMEMLRDKYQQVAMSFMTKAVQDGFFKRHPDAVQKLETDHELNSIDWNSVSGLPASDIDTEREL